MAIVKQPLHSLSASGSIGGAVSFRATAGGAVCTMKAKKYPQQSTAQLTNQARMQAARVAFRGLATADRNLWQLLATKYRRSAFACFFAEYQYQVVQAPNVPLIPEANL